MRVSRQLTLRKMIFIAFLGAISFATASCKPAQNHSQVLIETNTHAIEQALSRLESAEDGIQYSVWLGEPSGDVWLTHNADVIHPAASAIKTAILIEFFSSQINTLDEVPSEITALLDDPSSAAISHFKPELQATARAELRGLTARQLAEAMVHKEHVETNAAYNAAANFIIEYLGGPKALTARIHDRFPDAKGIQIDRYMLTNRQKNDDNLLTAESLASILRQLANAPANDILFQEAREVLFLENTKIGGDHYYKGGSLTSAPQVRIQAGWWEKNGKASIYVVIAAGPKDVSGKASYEALRDKLMEFSQIVQDTGIDLRGTVQIKP